MKPKKKLGQHWLHDQASLSAMADLAQVGAKDFVLEVGPGLGTLTEVLLQRGANVVAVEYDQELYELIKKELKNAEQLEVVHQDILRFDLAQLPPGYKVVANIPYYLTSKLVRVLSESDNPPQSVTLLIQKEVAERLAAGPGEMSLLSVTAQMYFESRLGPVVPAGLFTPPPKVDSQIIHLNRRQQPLFGSADSKSLFRLVKAGFSNRRKTLLNSLSGGLQLPKEETKALLEKADINPQNRAQDLSLEDWLRLNKSR
jgi:16S rRNA (adenine1518-N6/adenine1519-N6)-dimethyltransferase